MQITPSYLNLLRETISLPKIEPRKQMLPWLIGKLQKTTSRNLKAKSNRLRVTSIRTLTYSQAMRSISLSSSASLRRRALNGAKSK